MSARDAVAQQLELQRRLNPSMGGPDQRDYRNADDVLGALAAHGFVVVPVEPGTHRVTVHDDGTIEAVALGWWGFSLPLGHERQRLWVEEPSKDS